MLLILILLPYVAAVLRTGSMSGTESPPQEQDLEALVAEILLELQKNGIQIFVATHSYNFAKYLEIRRTETEQVQFHNLYHSEQPGVIEASSAYRMEDLHFNHIMMADNKLLDEIYDL